MEAMGEILRKTGRSPDLILNNPELLGVKPALPPARPETIRAGTPARFKVTETGQVVGTEFPEDILLRLGYREQELGRRMTTAELAGFFEANRPAAPAAAPKAEAKAKKPKPEAAAMADQMLTPEEAAKLGTEEFKVWMNPRFRFTYDPTNDSDMAAYTELVKALGLRGDDTVIQDVVSRIKKPEPPKTPPVPPAAALPAPPAATPPAPPPAKAKSESEVEFEPVAQKPWVAMKDKRTDKVYVGVAGETVHGDMVARLQGRGVLIDDMIPGWLTPEGKWTQNTAEATPKIPKASSDRKSVV